MKNHTKLAFSAIFILSLFSFRHQVYGAPARDAGATFRDVEGKEWTLLELRTPGKTVFIDRRQLEEDNFAGIYSANFQADETSGEGRLSGTGAPNRYFGPYSAGNNRTLNIGILAGTMMASFREPDYLKESEFFNYLEKVTRWDLNQGKLELYSRDSNGTEAVLVFGVK